MAYRNEEADETAICNVLPKVETACVTFLKIMQKVHCVVTVYGPDIGTQKVDFKFEVPETVPATVS